MQDDSWTTSRLLAWIESHLGNKDVHNPPLVARMLMTHVVGGTDIDLLIDPNRPASSEERDVLRDLVKRAASHEPVQYLVGKADFFGRSFEVDRSTLIPRQATESLVQVVLDWYRGTAPLEGPRPPLRLADLGCGTGCIGITLLRQVPGATVLSTDISDDVLALARRNADRHEVTDRMTCQQGPGLDPLGGHAPFDVICANLPYIPDGDWAGLDANVREHEPATALRGGPDGLDVIRPVIRGIRPHLAAGGLLVMEIDPSQAETVVEIAGGIPGVASVEVVRDEFGDNRLLRVTSDLNLQVS